MRNSKIVPLAVSLTVLSILAVLTVTLSGCGDSAPVTAYKDFEKALKDGDLETAWSLLSSDRQEAMAHDQFLEAFSLPSMKEVIEKMPPADIVSCEVDGDHAVITAEGTGIYEGNTSKTPLVLENGEWKLESAAGP